MRVPAALLLWHSPLKASESYLTEANHTETDPTARLKFEPDVLDFGEINNAREIKNRGQAVLTVINDGDRVLSGQINIQVGWIDVTPKTFRLNPGESSVHIFSIIKLSPTVWTTHRLGSDFIALITSNGGSGTVGGYYFSPMEETRKQAVAHPILKRTLYLLAILVLLVIGIVLGSRLTLQREDNFIRTQQAAIGKTQIAETMDANETALAPSETPLFGVTDYQAFNATAAAYGESLILNISSGSQPTNTPWPSGKYPTPQQFIISYYSYLNERNFDQAWWMLSEDMQVSCCYNGAGTPIENFRALMGDVSRYEVTQAYLQAENVNPAEVRYVLSSYNRNGSMNSSVLTALIIDDGQRNTLLIDEIK